MTDLIDGNPISDEKRNLKKACNHLERIRMRADKILNEPMSVHKMSKELKTLSEQAHLAHRRINELFFNNTHLFERLALGEEYDGL